MTRLLSKKQVKERVVYSFAHIDRLERAGLFPLRVRLGNGRCGWVEQEIEDWIQAKMALRRAPVTSQ